MKSIVFFNTFHNGDIHVSREFIKDIRNKVNNDLEYHHNNGPKLTLDIDVAYKRLDFNLYNYDNTKIIYEVNDIIYVNTWYNPNLPNFKYGCTLITLYENFKIVYQYLGIPIEPMNYYIPSFDFSKFNVSNIDQFVLNNKQIKIYISNGGVQSGQSVNFDFNPIINDLSSRFPQHLFIISNGYGIIRDNVIYSSDIIKSDNNDLCENSYLMSFCDIIIGRCSGTFSFGLTKDNLISDSKQIWVGICNINPNFGIEEFLNPNKKIYWINKYNINELTNDINNIIVLSYGNS